jgi:hypothetical protein
MKRIVVSYITRRHDKQILTVISKILNFTTEEKRQVGLMRKSGLIAALWGPSVELADESAGKAPESFNDFWADFLTASVEEKVILPDGVQSSGTPTKLRP